MLVKNAERDCWVHRICGDWMVRILVEPIKILVKTLSAIAGYTGSGQQRTQRQAIWVHRVWGNIAREPPSTD
jgi:hypothetical protein